MVYILTASADKQCRRNVKIEQLSKYDKAEPEARSQWCNDGLCEYEQYLATL